MGELGELRSPREWQRASGRPLPLTTPDQAKRVSPGQGALAELPLVDGHCHLVCGDRLDGDAFELAATEADCPAPAGVSYLDGQLGLAIRRWCAPALGLPPHVSTVDYLRRRAELGAAELLRRLVGGAGLSDLLVDTGLTGAPLCSLRELAQALAAGSPVATAPVVPTSTAVPTTLAAVHEVVRLETIAEQVAAAGASAAGFAAAVRDAVHAAAGHAVAVKSIVAYRYGLDLDPVRPTTRELQAAAGAWLATGGRLTDPTLLRFLLWTGVDTGLPVQLHTGFGDRDLALPRADPTLLQPWLAAVEPAGVPVVLLHCYPFHRQAGWLAQVYPQVYADVGLTVGHVGARARQVLAEFCELAPFGKLLFSTDAYLLPELYLVGAAQFRSSLGALLDGWVADSAISTTDAARIARMIAADNARRLYRLDR
jgi:predicted TIM-barrel fold metal-dependent hydrolase